MSALVIVACVAVVVCGVVAQEPPAKQIGNNLVTVTVIGTGMSKEDALRDAQRKAVEKGAGTFIYSQSQTKDFALVNDTILARAAGFVQKYEVKKSRSLDDGTVELTIEAIVSIKGIEDTWGVVQNLLTQMGRPKIMVFVSEKIGTEVVENSTVGTKIEEVLLKSGFLLVNKEQLKDIDKKDMAAAVAEDKPDKVQAIAKRFGAQIFISGSANAARGNDSVIGGVGLATYEGEANIRVYRSDTAQLMSSVAGVPERGVQRVPRSAAKQALDKEAVQVALRVQGDILQFWSDILEGRGEVQLHIEGVTFKQYSDLKKALKEVPAVKDVKAEFHNSIAECSIQSELNAEKLAEKLADGIKGLEIEDVTQNVIKAKFTK